MTSRERLAGSFRDPSGFLFFRDGQLYRQINARYREAYDHLLSSGLYERLVREELLIAHEEADVAPADPSVAYRVIQPERLRFVSYPYEWCFGQLKDAALTTLHIQKLALAAGMTLKDSSAYNIQFVRGRPVLIDTLSFERYEEGEPWVAYRQFCQHFLAPLALMTYRDGGLGRVLRVHLDGLPLPLTAALLPFRARLNPGLFVHIYLHASAQRRYAGQPVRTTRARRRMSRNALLGLIDGLEGAVRNLRWEPKDTEWGDYYEASAGHYSAEALAHKQDLVERFLGRAAPQHLWDLGANTGRFSRLASDRGIPTVAFDVDPAAVERNYRQSVAQGETHVLPLLIDLTNPSPGIGWENQERASLLERGPADAALALALIHHLAIGNNVPLEQLAGFFHRLCRWLIIEFVPKDDPQVQRLLAARTDIFPDYQEERFREIFAGRFQVHARERVSDSPRSLYLMEAR